MTILALEVLNQIADAVGWPQLDSIESPDLAPEERKLLRAFNRTIRVLVGINDWEMLRTQSSIMTLASELTDADPNGDGTDSPLSRQFVTATNGSDELTVAGYSFDSTYVERAIQVGGDETVYRIKAALSETVVQLNRVFVGTSIVVADEKVATIGADRYALPTNFSRMVNDAANFFGPYKIRAKSPVDLRQRRYRDRGIVDGDPDMFTVFGMNSGETNQLIHFHPYPENQRILEYDYIRQHPVINSDNDKILFPDRIIEPIINACVEVIKRQYDDDNRIELALGAAMKSYNEQMSNPGINASHLEMRPDVSVRTSIRRGFGRRGGFIDYGDYFDNVSNVGLF